MKLQHKLNPEVTNSPKRLLFPCSGAADQDIEPGLEANSKKTQVPRKHKFQILEFLKVIYWSCFEILRQFEILFHHLDSEIVCPSVSLLSFWTCVAGVAYVWRVRAGWLFQLQKVKWTGMEIYSDYHNPSVVVWDLMGHTTLEKADSLSTQHWRSSHTLLRVCVSPHTLLRVCVGPHTLLRGSVGPK